MPRTPLRWIGLVLLAALGLGLTAPDAHAESAFRYWSYATADDGAWTPAATGPAEVQPEEGSVQGMRFAVHGTTARVPRATADFDAVCAGTEAGAQGVRVAVVVDPGTPEDAPDGATPGPATGTCVLAAPGDSAQDVLAAAAELRTDDSGLICALDGYPATGCGDPAPAPADADDAPVELEITAPVGFPAGAGGGSEPGASTGPAAEDGVEGGGAPSWLLPLVAVLAAGALVGGGVLLSRRRGRDDAG